MIDLNHTIFLCQVDYNSIIKVIGFDNVLNYSKINSKDIGKFDCSAILDGLNCPRIATISLTYIQRNGVIK